MSSRQKVEQQFRDADRLEQLRVRALVDGRVRADAAGRFEVVAPDGRVLCSGSPVRVEEWLREREDSLYE